MSDHVVKLLYKVLKAYDVSITKHTIQRTVLTHPDYPSMQCISDALDEWKVKHVVLKLSLEKLRKLDVPVIAHLKKGEYAWVTKLTETSACYWSASGKERNENLERFEQDWSGFVLAIEDVTNAGEPNFREEHNKELKENIFKYTLAGGCAALLILLMFLSWSNDNCLSLLPKLLLFFFNIMGCYIAYTLIRQEKHQSNRLVRMFCKAGTHIDCNQVTTSHYSKLFGMLSWAELGMAYFSTVILWIVIAPINPNWLSSLWWFLILPLPFTVWSLFVQAFLIRKWCLFCCAIVFLLWINAIILYFFFPCGGELPIIELLLAALLFAVCIGVVKYACEVISHIDLYSEQKETARIKYNFQTIQCQLSELDYEVDNVGFRWGNLQSAHEITLYVSTTCSHCGKAMKELRRLIEVYPDFSYRLVFAVRSNDFDNESNTVIRHFISHYKSVNENEFFDLLDTWYGLPKKTLEALQNAFHTLYIPSINEAEMKSLYQFSQQAKISYTPAMLIDKRLLSQLYSYLDLNGIARALNTGVVAIRPAEAIPE